MLEIILSRIKAKKENPILDKAKKDYQLQKKIYTGLDQEDIVTEYRKKESKNQKDQRNRITISRTKHVSRQIENILNQLDLLDKPSIDILHESNENIVDDIKTWIYNNNIDKLAFEFVKFNNLVDSNACIIAGLNEFEELEFTVYNSSQLYDIYVLNDFIKYVVFKIERQTKEQKVDDYYIYFNNEFIKLVDELEYRGQSLEKWDRYYIETYDTKLNYSFRVGAIKDPTNNLKTCLSLFEPASELFKSLMWQGSELDTTKATHGMIKQFMRATPCTNVNYTPEGPSECMGGKMYRGQTILGSCNKCNGTGLAIHTSSQDIIMLPMPLAGEERTALSDLIHIEYVPDGFLNFLKEDIRELKDEIIRTVFNATNLTKSEIAQTATEAIIDLQGIYATLNMLGKKVSDAFIWMVEVYCDIKGYEGVSVLHGYTLNLKLETIESLSDKRKKLTESGAPMEVIKAVDMAILQKQHIDNPIAIDKYAIWDKYKPFSEKSNDQVNTILAGLPDINYHKVLYNFFGIIKQRIINKVGSEFYVMTHERRISLIDEEVNILIEQLKADKETSTSQPSFNFNDVE
jgi:hypothetical protein